jgi:radical SAM superfamily enzyme YgiQ (UPF0313 family)
MNILFLIPTISGSNNKKIDFSDLLWKVIFTPPLTFEMLAAVTPLEHTISLLDERIEKINFNKSYDVVGITVITSAASRAYECADEFRRRGITVVLGGWHPSVFPDEAKQHADTVVIGEGENSWLHLLQDLEKGTLKPFYNNIQPVDFQTLPPPRRKFSHNRGFVIGEIQATRGCSMGCHYCAITNRPFGRIWRCRPIENVIKEIETIPQKFLYFSDSSLTENPQYTKQLFRAMKDSNKKIFCNGNTNILHHDEELIKLSSEAGCLEWSIGFESVSQESLNSIGKQTNKVHEFAATVKKIHDYGIAVNGNFIFGMDEDHPDIFDKTIDAVQDWELDLSAFSLLTPFPGTPLFERLEKEKRILTKDWSQYDLRHVVFRPKYLSPLELFDETQRVHDEIYSLFKTMKRSIKSLRFGLYPFFTTTLQNITN